MEISDVIEHSVNLPDSVYESKSEVQLLSRCESVVLVYAK